jgi:methionyl-tRNA formyltransferase
VNNNKLKFAFFGTPDVASETLEIIKKNGFLPLLIITSPDAKKGRGLLMQASPAAIFAEQNNISCLKPEKLEKIDWGNVFTTIDFFLVVAYGKIIPEDILNIPKFGSINIHYSLLPKYRGASPVESAILNGDKETGVTIQKMKFKMDSGPIIAQEKVEIFPNEKASELRIRLIKIGGELLVKILKTPSFLPLIKGEVLRAVGVEQDESQATFCKKIKKEDGLIDLNDKAEKNYNKFRAYATWPRTFFFKNQKRIIITDAVLENNPFDKAQGKQFIIKKVLPEGKKEIKWEEFNTSK